MGMASVDINYIAVFVATLVSFVLGFLWYSPSWFGTTWMKLSGIDMKKAKAAQKKGMGKTMFIGFLSTLVMAYVLAWFIKMMSIGTAIGGMQTAFWIWLGFFAMPQLGIVLWERKPVQLYYINTGHYLVTLLIMGAILAVW